VTARPPHDVPEPGVADVIERRADDAALRQEARTQEVKQTRDELPPRQIARRAEEHHHLRGERRDVA
jgi:hypothetical protein